MYGETGTAAGYGGYFVGRGYFSNNVGIGMVPSSSKLTVAGNIESTTGGFKFPDGTTQTTAATGDGGDSPWVTTGSDIYYSLGNVGVGVPNPAASVHLAGGNWDLATGEGDFKIGTAAYRLKMGVDTAGSGAGHCRIYASGGGSKLTLGASINDRLTVASAGVGIGTTEPSAMLDVDGTIRLRNGASSGYVLTSSDSQGNASWQPGGGGGSFSLPYDGTIASGDTAFSLSNNGMGHALEGISVGGNGVYAKGWGPYSMGVEAEGGGIGADYPTLQATAIHPSGVAFKSTSDSSNPNAIFTNEGTGDLLRAYNGSSSDPVFKVDNAGKASVKRLTATGTNLGTAITAINNHSTASAGYFRNDGSGPALSAYGGKTVVEALEIVAGSDLSEQFDVTSPDADTEPGMVVCIDPANPGKLMVSAKAYDRTVAGVISGAGGIDPGMTMGQRGSVADGDHPVALTGRVYVRAETSNGPIVPGDLLTTSNVPGHAMKVTDFQKSNGAMLGKAMTSLDEGTGLVLILVSLQ